MGTDLFSDAEMGTDLFSDEWGTVPLSAREKNDSDPTFWKMTLTPLS
jgi:hypothetical protein